MQQRWYISQRNLCIWRDDFREAYEISMSNSFVIDELVRLLARGLLESGSFEFLSQIVHVIVTVLRVFFLAHNHLLNKTWALDCILVFF